MKRLAKTICLAAGIVLFVLAVLNPDRGSFNHAVFEGGKNAITGNQTVKNEILNTNRKDYNDDAHPFVKRHNYVVFSIYDVTVGQGRTYRILGIARNFCLLNPAG